MDSNMGEDAAIASQILSQASTTDEDGHTSTVLDMADALFQQDATDSKWEGSLEVTAYESSTQTQNGRTLLPFPLAKAVTYTTQSASRCLQVGTSVGSLAFRISRYATLSGINLSRHWVEGIITRAGKDVMAVSRSDFSRAQTAGFVERGLTNIHTSITAIALATSACFQSAETYASSTHHLTQFYLGFIDQLLGSTESSRAIASILTLIRREFQNPATGEEGERVGMLDLLQGLALMVVLQVYCRDMTENDHRKQGVDEVIWDVVVDVSGERFNFHHNSLYGMHNGSYNNLESKETSRTMDKSTNTAVMNAIQNHSVQQSSDEDDDLPEVHLKNQILQSLPEEAKVTIKTETTTSKTITVEISGASPPPLSPPPGAELVEQGPTKASKSKELTSRRQDTMTGDATSYRYVYRMDRNSFRTTDIHRTESGSDNDSNSETLGLIEASQDSSTEDGSDQDTLDIPPPVPPKGDMVSTRSRTSPPSTRSGTPTKGYMQSTRAGTSRSTPPPESANQKRQRAPLKPKSAVARNEPPPKPKQPPPPKKASSFRAALKKGPAPALSTLVRRESADGDGLTLKASRKSKTAPVSPVSPAVSSFSPLTPSTESPSVPQIVVPGRSSSTAQSLVPKRDAPPPPIGINNGSSSAVAKITPSRSGGTPDPLPRSHSRTSYFAVHERKRDSLVSQSDTYSIHTLDSNRPISPTMVRTDATSSGAVGLRPQSRGSLSKSRSEKDIAERNPLSSASGSSQSRGTNNRHHRRSRSQNPSICTLKTSDSQTSLVLSSFYSRSAYSDVESLNGLRSTGIVPGMFPACPFVRNITRYMLFSSASYGSSFLKVMGISKQMAWSQALNDDTHHELSSYAHHTQSDTGSILLSSFVDPQGGSDSTGSTNTGVPLAHYISLDKEAKAVVLACRGTLGFEDVLADMTCDYDDLLWRGRSYKVHKGIHASARRLLYGGDGRVLAILKAALEEYKDYGLVLCGHSLGGAVTALLGVMLSEPSALPTGPAFVTSASSLQSTSSSERTTKNLCLPAGRPIHVFAYGPPGTMSASLRKATRGLITSIVHGDDIVPSLSLGVLHDLQAVAIATKNDNSEAKKDTNDRLWTVFRAGLARAWQSSYSAGGAPSGDNVSSDTEDGPWTFAALKIIRSQMMSMKLLPPGEVFTLEKTRVHRRDAFVAGGPPPSEGGDGSPTVGAGATGFFIDGTPATRIVLKYIKSPDVRFGEVRFTKSMLTDHNPKRYEEALSLLNEGVMPQ
ncbi:hypothetical protein PspLS_08027 [Pyricularia sp. CBS 133598]|nr:hypothetical protein PspLS_08027 [Pyricularia sp. CBS 133598]